MLACADVCCPLLAAVEDTHGRELHLSAYRGRVVLFVNVASQCGYTDSNYEGLQAVYNHYGNYGFDILAFPCNDFGEQEPWTNSEIATFVAGKYHVNFTLLAKIEHINHHPVFDWLRHHGPEAPGGDHGDDITWNFK